MKPFKEWRPWQRRAVIAVAFLLLAYGLFVAFAMPSNGTKVHVYAEVGTLSNGDMYFRCDAARSTQGSCEDGTADQARIHVHQRDRLTLTVHSADGGGRAHDVKMDGIPYILPPARMEMELHKATQSRTITAYASGTYKLWCEVGHHDEDGMHATLIVD